ncbi:NAD(P)H-dependent oxidoreductase subunit E [Brucepastera parasyntrophica]|uniref:NADH-quinone oxidoreductase subunit NuoE family protein n=1 Tax=Brucepastera parasyntrophica TaxID=2880008 RepID=UPI00210D00E3|nr:NAD(P)H-dependent oxidoreductase subunit E [Brucepastera parasyntrophica]ULQ58947.1 NAD(P)H-dependent oxidoreductase subunit E [Brucepastera parasyntrophica]
MAAACEFSGELNAFIDEWKTKPGNLIMILHKVQEEKGYISKESAVEVAERTGMPLARVYGTMTFYHFFKTVKPGKNRISVCLGTACYLKGGQDLIDEARTLLGLASGEITTHDGLFSVEPVRCIGCCGLAPVLTVNGDVYGKLSKNQIDEIIATYQNK